MIAINMLLDSFTDPLPIMGELTSVAPHASHWLENLLRDLLGSDKFAMVMDAGMVCFLVHIGVFATGAYMTLHGAYLAYKSVQPASVGKFEVLGIKASWLGPVGVGMMVGGILVMLLSSSLPEGSCFGSSAIKISSTSIQDSIS
jgi:hypothetical protein